MLKALHEAGVILHCDNAVNVIKAHSVPSTVASEENWATEYGTLEMNVAIVDSVDGACDHIAGTAPSTRKPILTENKEMPRALLR